ncbi:MAG: DUF1801 domain-containing protein [Candidatus Woykebacteria bacterium]
MDSRKAKDIDEYISAFSKDLRTILQQVRQTIQKAAPEAKEKIGYGIPTFTFHGNLVHFAAFEHHIGFYPAPSAIVTFKKELAPYKQAKGSVQFPLDKPIPFDLITKMVRYRVEENSERKSGYLK